MAYTYKLSFLFLFAAIFCFSFGTVTLAQSAPQTQTNSATNIQNNSVTLNANLTNYGSTIVYFQWGTTTSYGYQTTQQTINYSGLISQNISGLNFNTTYHFRAVAQNNYGIVYGQDMTFISAKPNNALTANAGPDLYLTSGQTTASLQGSGYNPNGYSMNYSWTCNGGTLSNYNIAQPVYTINNYNNQAIYTCTLTVSDSYGNSNSDSTTIYVNYNNYSSYGNGILTVNKQVINLSSKNLIWQASINAKPSDILSFAITLHANSQDVHNLAIRDILPANLIYKRNLVINTNSNYSGDIISGININTINAGQTITMAYQAQVASLENFNYGKTTITNNTTTTSNEGGTQNSSATVIVNKSLVQDAITISTGFTNNFLTDSFFLPLMLIIMMSWLYFSGRVYKFADWLRCRTSKYF